MADTPTSDTPCAVLVVVDSLLVGGAERCAVDMAVALDRSRFAPRMVVTRQSGPLATVLEQGDVPLAVIERSRRFDLRALRALRQAIRDVDVVHAHKFTTACWVALAALGTGTPWFAHEHNFAGARSRLRGALNRWLIGRRARRIFSVSESVTRSLEADGVSADRIETIPNAVMPDVALKRRDARDVLGLDADAPIIGMIAGLRPEKAHEVAIDALADPRLTAAGVRLCIVGDGPREQALREHAEHAGVADRIDWTGSVSDQIAADRSVTHSVSAGAALASAFDVALVCSDWEGLPLFALESLMAVVPLVATRVGELPDLLRDDAGLLVPPRNPAALADAINSLVSDPTRATQIAARGAARARDHHSFPTLVARLEQHYLNAVGKPSPRQSQSDAHRDAA